MTDAAYYSLAKLAARRIEQEWTCNASERALLLLVAELSFQQQQSCACVPCLSKFVVPLEYHKSTISRAIHSACKKGYLVVLKTGGETLYAINLRTRAEKRAADGAPTPAEVRAAAKAELIAMQKARLRGCADHNGQFRFMQEGFFDPEEIDAPAMAFEAMMEEEVTPPQAVETKPARSETEPVRPPETSRPQHDDTTPPGADYWRKLVGGTEAGKEAATVGSPPPQSPPLGVDTRFERLLLGLPTASANALRLVREEVETAGPAEMETLLKWGTLWRERAEKWPLQLAEAAGLHKVIRREKGAGTKFPGGAIYRNLEKILGSRTPDSG